MRCHPGSCFGSNSLKVIPCFLFCDGVFLGGLSRFSPRDPRGMLFSSSTFGLSPSFLFSVVFPCCLFLERTSSTARLRQSGDVLLIFLESYPFRIRRHPFWNPPSFPLSSGSRPWYFFFSLYVPRGQSFLFFLPGGPFQILAIGLHLFLTDLPQHLHPLVRGRQLLRRLFR